MQARVVFFLALACTRSTQPTGDSPSPPAPARDAAASDIVPVPDGDAVECDALCGSQAACFPSSVFSKETCLVNCKQLRRQATALLQCRAAVETNHACLKVLDCAQWREQYSNLQMGQPPKWCHGEDRRMGLYCSPNNPQVLMCLRNCTSAKECGETTSEVEPCALRCLDDLQQLYKKQGAECWNATSNALICKSFLSCKDRRPDRVGQVCRGQVDEQKRKCTAP